MSIRSMVHFDDGKIWVVEQTWDDMSNSQSVIPVASVLVGAAEGIRRGGALVIHAKDGDIKRRCDRLDELQTLIEEIDESRKKRGLQSLLPMAG